MASHAPACVVTVHKPLVRAVLPRRRLYRVLLLFSLSELLLMVVVAPLPRDHFVSFCSWGCSRHPLFLPASRFRGCQTSTAILIECSFPSYRPIKSLRKEVSVSRNTVHVATTIETRTTMSIPVGMSAVFAVSPRASGTVRMCV